MERLVSAYCEGLILLKNFMNKKFIKVAFVAAIAMISGVMV